MNVSILYKDSDILAGISRGNGFSNRLLISSHIPFYVSFFKNQSSSRETFQDSEFCAIIFWCWKNLHSYPIKTREI